MAVAKVKRVELAGLASDRYEWLKALQAAEVVEIEQLGEDSPVLGNEAESREALEKELGVLDHEMADIQRALAFIERFFPVRPNAVQQFTGVRTYLTAREFNRMTDERDQVAEAVQKAGGLNDALSENAHRREALSTEKRALAPWEKLDLSEEELTGTRHVQVLLGTVELRQLAGLQAALSAAGFGSHSEAVGWDERYAYVLLFVPGEGVESLGAILSAATFNAVTLPGFGHRVADRLETIERELVDIAQNEAELVAQVDGLAQDRYRMQAVHDFLMSEAVKLRVAAGLATGEHSFYFRGWILAQDLPRLSKTLDGVGRPYFLATRDPEEGETPPSHLRNTPLITPFESVLQMFSYPKYTEIDPTSIMGPFFFLAFGFAYGDAGYGLILGLFNLILLRYLPMRPNGKKLAWTFVFGSISAIAFGFLTGGFFGNILGLKPIIGFDPTLEPIKLLILALGFGVVEMFFGLMVAMVIHAKQDGWLAALAGEGTFALFLALAMLFLGGGSIGLQAYAGILQWAFIGSAVLVILGAAYGKTGMGILLAVPAGLFKMYNSIGFFSDVLSFARLMALALSGAVVGNIVNTFVLQAFASPMYGLGYFLGALIFVFGHLLNLSLNVLGAYVHASRLQYLELFGKFFEGGGRPFSPLKPEYKYVQIIHEKEA